MDQNLQMLFERALDEEPPAPGDQAAVAMVAGSRLRRNRRLRVGGSAAAALAALTAVVAMNVSAPGGEAVQVAGASRPTTCSAAVNTANYVAVFLSADVTDKQRRAVQQFLTADPGVLSTRFESREQAFQHFKELWHDSPDFIKSVGPDSLPESFRTELARPSHYPALVTELRALAGVQDIVGSLCPPGVLPEGGK